MNNNEIREVIAARFKTIRKYCDDIPKYFAVKDIHGFRTEVKKLRAYIRIVTFRGNDTKEFKLPRKLKKIYSAAGAIRDIQLQLERIKAATLHDPLQPVEYSDLLKKDMRKNQKLLKKLIEETSLHSLEKKIVNSLPGQLEFETVRNFIQNKIDGIKSLSTKKEEKDDDIHSIRKNLKDLMYNVKNIRDVYLKEAFPADLSDDGKMKSVEKLTDQLGMFTDMSAAISFTEPAYLDALNSKEKDQLQNIRGKWLHEKDQLRQTALKDISLMDQ